MLCNLRCKYCYEWDSLSDPGRMSKEVWKHALEAIREYSNLAEKQQGFPVYSDIIWHGGEPLLLPVSYYEMVLDLQKEIFPNKWLDEHRIRNCIQTNLYSLSDDHLRILTKNNYDIGVSFDFIGGARLTSGGKETLEQTKSNLLKLKERGVYFEVITVIAKHTIANYDRLFQEIKELDVPIKLLPLFGGPISRNLEGVEASRDEVLFTMHKLFVLWLNNNMQPRIHPFDLCIQTLVMKRLGLKRRAHDRAKLGSEVFVIDRDGSLSCAAHRSSYVIGNVCKNPIDVIMSSDKYGYILQDEFQLKKSVCESCNYFNHCDTSPLASNFDSYEYKDCVIEKKFYSIVEAYLEEIGFFGPVFLEYSNTLLSQFVQDEMGLTPV